MRKLLLFFSIIKYAVWLSSGLAFGISTFTVTLASKLVDTNQLAFTGLISYDFIVFLCVALMAAASTDCFTSPDSGWGFKVVPGLISVIMLLIAAFIYHPNLPNKPNPTFIRSLTNIYTIVTFFFCGVLKCYLFYEEASKLNEDKF